jgi:hypothetical protein
MSPAASHARFVHRVIFIQIVVSDCASKGLTDVTSRSPARFVHRVIFILTVVSDCAATGFTDVTSSVTCKVCTQIYIYTDSSL